MLNQALFWLILAVVVASQALLVRSAWLLRRREASLPEGMPRSNGGADLAWTLAIAALTGLLLFFAYRALP